MKAVAETTVCTGAGGGGLSVLRLKLRVHLPGKIQEGLLEVMSLEALFPLAGGECIPVKHPPPPPRAAKDLSPAF